MPISRSLLVAGILAVFVTACDATKSFVAPADDVKLSVNVPEVRSVPAGVRLPLVVRRGRTLDTSGHVEASSTDGALGRLETRPVLDVEAAAAESPSLVWYGNDGSATLWKMSGASWSLDGATVLQIPLPWTLATAGDMNGDSYPDLIWESTDGMKAVTFMRGPAYGGSYQMMLSVPAQWRIAGAADLSGDNKTDLILENTSTGEHVALLMNGAAYSGTLVSLPQTAPTLRLAAVGDINGDAKPDLIWEDKSTGARSFTPMSGTTAGAAKPLGNVDKVWEIGAAGDYNGDAQADLVVQNMTDGQRRILFVQNQLLTGQYSQLHTVPTTLRIVAATPLSWTVPVNAVITDVASLRAAINAAPNNSRVTIPPGIYDLGNTSLKIDSKTNVEIFGSGRGQTILRGGSLAEYIVELVGTNDNLKVGHMTLEGAATPGRVTYGIGAGHLRFSTINVTYFDLDVKNVTIGVSMVASGNGTCYGVQVLDNYLDNIQDYRLPDGSTSGSGYGIHNDQCTDVRIAGNVIRNADRHSIYQSKAYQADRPGNGSIVIENNLIIDHGKTSSTNLFRLVAIVVARTRNVVVAHNVIVNSYEDAFSIENAPEEGVTYVVDDVRLIDNVVLGSRADDVFLTAAGPFIHWGNRYYHNDTQLAPSAPRVYKDGLGVGGSLVEPAAYPGTQSIATATSLNDLAVMQGNVVTRTTAVYNNDPSSWARIGTGYTWSAFEAMAASADRLFVVNNRRLYEVDAGTFTTRNSATVFPTRSIPAYVNGQVILVSGNQLYKFDSALGATSYAAPGSGTIHGMAAFKNKLYLYVGACHYEVDPATLASTTIGCE